MKPSLFCTALTLLVIASHQPAVARSADADWAAGKQAFSTGNYEAALACFERARDDGMTGPAVHYNIAVSQYSLGRYADADATFELIAERFPKMRALAQYNLGLTATRLGQEADATEHFRSAYDLSANDRKLRVLASRQLRIIEPEARTAARWSGAIGVRAGNDDNVALLDETGLATGTTTDSPLAEVFASFAGPWNGREGLRFEGSAYVVRYADADEFDQSEIRGGAFYEWRPKDWRLQFGLQASTGAIGGDAYDRKAGPRIRVVRYLDGNANVDLRYRFDDVSEADSVFAGLEGDRQVFDARYNYYQGAHALRLRFIRETNDRLDPGFSPDRSQVEADYRYRPERGFGFSGSLSLRNSEYDGIATPRDEDLTTLRGALTYSLSNDWLLLLEYSNASNDSTDPAFAYDRAQVTLGALKFF